MPGNSQKYTKVNAEEVSVNHGSQGLDAAVDWTYQANESVILKLFP